MNITAIIVTHNSAVVIGKAVAALRAQTLPPAQIIIVDSGSGDTAYLQALAGPDLLVIPAQNIGFCAANNRGVAAAGPTDGYLFVNPDCFLAPDWLERATAALAAHPETGLLSSPLLGYDITADAPSGKMDSAGIARSRLGRWYDVGQGQPIGAVPLPATPWEPQAICGALMLMPQVVAETLRRQDGCIFDESLFMYKDDIDLSLRVRRLGYRLLMLPTAHSWHCRGWNPDRCAVPQWARRMSARNEVRVALRHRSAYLPLYLLKYTYVRWCEK
jgi:GT2 family glycosyltransferase